MITRMLHDLGLFIGWDVNDEHEATFFLNRNEKILNISGGSWHHPHRIDVILTHDELHQKLTDALAEDLSAWRCFSFLGPKLFVKYRSLSKLDFPWGWKDPRNTFLLPLWLKIYPEAKIIHIYRNGLDVAQSLARREEKRIGRLNQKRRGIADFARFQRHQFDGTNTMAVFMRKIQNRYRKLSPLDKYEKFRIHHCISLAAGFELWCNYVERAFEYSETRSNEILTIRYEDFLLDPEPHLSELQAFCSLPAGEDKIKLLSSQIRTERRFAFKEDESLLFFYEKIKDHYWMKKLGYNDLYSQSPEKMEHFHGQ